MATSGNERTHGFKLRVHHVTLLKHKHALIRAKWPRKSSAHNNSSNLFLFESSVTRLCLHNTLENILRLGSATTYAFFFSCSDEDHVLQRLRTLKHGFSLGWNRIASNELSWHSKLDGGARANPRERLFVQKPAWKTRLFCFSDLASSIVWLSQFQQREFVQLGTKCFWFDWFRLY